MERDIINDNPENLEGGIVAVGKDNLENLEEAIVAIGDVIGLSFINELDGKNDEETVQIISENDKNKKENKYVTPSILDEKETDIPIMKISEKDKLAKALLGKKTGDVVKYEVKSDGEDGNQMSTEILFIRK